MKPEIWTPHVTVSALVERAGRFLMIEEETSTGLRINQPAGHLEAGETLVDAVIRETLEETARAFTPDALIGVYLAHYARPGRAGATYLRFAFCGTAGDEIAGRGLDGGIVRTLWMSADELRACVDRHRSPAVMRCVEDYLAGRRIPLDFVHTHSVAPRPELFLGQAQADGK
ncbi:NUDIX hydrolase [Burkholderia guangdongensis]|uniref:NUDIX hydrolase n=1 Tax=Burkholderia guangdongensis TaxID=1792500 RepID=UPI0015CCB4DB|nr:NUDIX hydrolase [Burkholderia guangdongensis]